MEPRLAALVKWFCARCPEFPRRVLERVLRSHLARRFLRGAFWVILGSVLSRGLGMLATVGVARILGKERYGEIGLVQNTVTMLATLAGLGLGLAATKFIAECRQADPAKAGRILAMVGVVTLAASASVSVLLLVGAPWVATFTLSAPDLTGPVRIAAVLLFFSGINSVQMSALAGFEAFRALATINLLCGLVSLPLLLCGTCYWGLPGSLWAYAAANAMNCALSQRALRGECKKAGIRYSCVDSWKERAILGSFSIPILASGLSGAFADWVVSTTLASQPKGYGQLGLLSAARQWSTLILYLPGLLATISLPLLSSLLGEGRQSQFRKVLLLNSLAICAAATALAVPVALFAKPIMRMYGQGFAEGAPILMVNCCYCVLNASCIVVGQAMWSMNLVRAGVIFALARAVLILVLWSLLISRGAMGVALTYCFAYVIQAFYLIPYICIFSRRIVGDAKGTGATQPAA